MDIAWVPTLPPCPLRPRALTITWEWTGSLQWLQEKAGGASGGAVRGAVVAVSPCCSGLTVGDTELDLSGWILYEGPNVAAKWVSNILLGNAKMSTQGQTAV